MNKQIIEVIEDLKAKQETIDNLNQTKQEQFKKLNNLKAKQESEFDFEREEQITNKQSALNKLQSNIDDKENEFEDLFEGHDIKLNGRIRRDKRNLIKEDKDVKTQLNKVTKLKQEYEDSKIELKNELEKFDHSYDDKLFDLGNDVVGFRIDEMNIDDYMTKL